MSWGYWGIVLGLLALVVVTFFSLDLFYHQQPPAGGEDGQASGDTPAVGKHAA